MCFVYRRTPSFPIISADFCLCLIFYYQRGIHLSSFLFSCVRVVILLNLLFMDKEKFKIGSFWVGM